MSETHLRDVIKWNSPPEEIAAQLRGIGTAIIDSAQWTKDHLPRDERNLTLFNLLVAPLHCIDLYAQNVLGPLPVLAFCARTVFELDVRARHVIRSTDGLKKWIAEAADDRSDLVKAFKELAEPGDQRDQLLDNELLRIDILKVKHKIPELRKADTLIATLAREVGLERERKSLFKILSKLVHPTSYLVNSGIIIEDDDQMRNILLIHFQLYALDLLKRITGELGVPPELTSCRPRKQASKIGPSNQTGQIQ